MTLTVNFASETHDEMSLSLRDLIKKKRWSFPLIIARINGELVERASYETTLVHDGDDIELYHLVSGG
jgi:sulfur carrier protein